MSRPIAPWQTWAEMLGLLRHLQENGWTFDIIAIEGPDDTSHPGLWWLAIVHGYGEPGALYIPRGELATDQSLATIAAGLQEDPNRPRSAQFWSKHPPLGRYHYTLRQVLP